jgi:Tol biopolymer transport system component
VNITRYGIIAVCFLIAALHDAIGVTSPLYPIAVDPRGDWQALESEHVVVLYPGELRALAEEAVSLAEGAHSFWTQKLQYSPREKIYLILMDRSDLLRTATRLLPHTVLVIDHPFGWSAERWQSPEGSWLAEVIHREYGRIIDAGRVEGLAGSARAVWGKLILPGLVKPLWLREGLGALAGTDSSLAEMILRTMAAAREFPTVAQLSSPYRKATWPPAHTQTQAVGGMFLAYLEQMHDPDAMRVISRAYASIPGVPATVGELYGEFQNWATEQAAHLTARIESQGGETPYTRIASLGFWSDAPTWSPDGSWIVYRHDDPRRLPGVRRVRPHGVEDQPLLECECGLPIWLNELTLVYPKLTLQDDGSLLYDLYQYVLPTRHEERITQGERAYSVESFSDGRRLLIARNAKEGKSSLIILDLVTRSRQILKEFSTDERIHSLAVSPDGRLIALSLWSKQQGQDIYLMSSEGGTLIALTQDPASDFDPMFSPTTEYILFSSDREGVFDIYAVRIGDRQLYRVTRSFTGSFDPAISPDGQDLAFISYDSEGFQLYKAPYDPSRWQRVPSGDANTPPSAAMMAPPQENPHSLTSGPYDPAPALIPTYWLPLVGLSHVGLYTHSEDPLRRHSYALSAGANLDSLRFFYDLRYTNAQTTPTLKLRVQGNPLPDLQEMAVEFALAASGQSSRTVALGLARTRDIAELFLSVDLHEVRGFDLVLRRSALSLSGGLGWAEGLVHRLVLQWQEQLQLPFASSVGPHEFAFRASAAWSSRGEFHLGGISGQYPLRGFDELASGSQLVLSSMEYRFPVWAIEWGCCNGAVWPLFLDDLWGALFLDVGAVGAALDLDQLRMAVGIELRLQVVLGFGLAHGNLRLGFAYGFGSPQPQLYVTVGPTF